MTSITIKGRDMGNGTAAIEARGLTKSFNGRTVVHEVSFQVHAGEVFGFVGLNGAGKTTVMRMLVGLAKPSAGAALILGEDNLHDGLLRRVGTMIESPGFYPALSGNVNLRTLCRYWGLPTSGVKEKLEVVDLLTSADQPFKQYSMGMKQRLALAAALLGDPSVLILDEPTNGLDPSGVVAIRDLLRSLAAAGCAVLLSSHILSEISQICDRVGVIHHGRMVAVATPRELQDLVTSGRKRVLVRAEPAAEAMEAIRRVPGVSKVVQRSDGALEVEADPSVHAQISAAVVHAGAGLTGFQVLESTLEEAFLALTHPSEGGEG